MFDSAGDTDFQKLRVGYSAGDTDFQKLRVDCSQLSPRRLVNLRSYPFNPKKKENEKEKKKKRLLVILIFQQCPSSLYYIILEHFVSFEPVYYWALFKFFCLVCSYCACNSVLDFFFFKKKGLTFYFAQ